MVMVMVSKTIGINQYKLTSLGPLLVHDSVATFTTSNGVLWFDLVLVMTFTTDIDHGLLLDLWLLG